MARRPPLITLSPDERGALEGLLRRPSTAQQLARRAQMILLAADGVGVGETARRLGLWRKGVSFWRARWTAEVGKGTRSGVVERLCDAPRSGAPPTITPEQTCALITLACERPDDGGVPMSHWSAGDLAREAVRRGLVPAISPRSVGRHLKRSRSQAASRPTLADAQARS